MTSRTDSASRVTNTQQDRQHLESAGEAAIEGKREKENDCESESGSESSHEGGEQVEERTLELLRHSVLEMSFNRIDGPEDLYLGG